MNAVIESLLSHRSIRAYRNDPVEDDQLELILRAAQAAPNWINGQQVSVVVVRDPARKARLAELCNRQKHIEQAPVFLVFCADFHRLRLAGELEQMPPRALEVDFDPVIVAATDVGIALGTAVAAAESLGLGTVPIGAIRRNAAEVVKELQLPEYVFPISGLCVGHPAEDPGIKPRLPLEAFAHGETYNPDQLSLMQRYNAEYADYLKRRGESSPSPNAWTKRIASFYANRYYEGVLDALERQKLLPSRFHR
jgi:FMN reductase [NAD(P)H]